MSYYELGQRIGATALGLDNVQYDMMKQAYLVDTVEYQSPELRDLNTAFWRSFCGEMAALEKQANGDTQDYFLLKQLAEQPLWCEEFQKMASAYAETLLDGKEQAQLDHMEKEAAAIASLIPGTASRAISTTPTLIKAMLAAGVGTGITGGGLYWALQRAATEDSDAKLDVMQAKIDEYGKLKAMLQQSADPDFVEEEAATQKKINKL